MSRSECWTLFWRSSKVIQGKSIVEIGSYKGRSTIALALGASKGVPVYAVDPHTGGRYQLERGEFRGSLEEFSDNLQKAGVANVIPVVATSEEAAREYFGLPVGLLFIDGWHSADAVRADFLAWKGHMADDCVVIFDDADDPEVSDGIESIQSQITSPIDRVGKLVVFALRYGS